MLQGTLVPDIAEVELVSLGRVAGMIEMRLKTCRACTTCPACGTSSRKVHSRYKRRLADLPLDSVPVVIQLQMRRFFCVEPGCRRKVFAEPLLGTVSRYGRRSCRASEALRWLTLALGGRAGARLAERLGLLASRSTLLRELHQRRPAPLVQAPRVLGIDDWAWRKGHRYGTILCDLETRKVVDLLPDRDANSVAAWLRQHPGTEIVSRNRGGGLSTRQTRRLVRAYRSDNGGAFIYKACGRTSNNPLIVGAREDIVELVRTRHADFGQTLAAAVLLEKDSVKVSRETLRKWMIQDGLWLLVGNSGARPLHTN